jgi:hypothetical protein
MQGVGRAGDHFVKCELANDGTVNSDLGYFYTLLVGVFKLVECDLFNCYSIVIQLCFINIYAFYRLIGPITTRFVNIIHFVGLLISVLALGSAPDVEALQCGCLVPTAVMISAVKTQTFKCKF